jgi:hypothetical protein
MESGVCHEDHNKLRNNQQPEMKSSEVNKKPTPHEGEKLCSYSKNFNNLNIICIQFGDMVSFSSRSLVCVRWLASPFCR